MKRIRSILDLWRDCALIALLVAGDCWISPPRQGFWITSVTPGPGGTQSSSTEPVTPPRHGIEIRRQAVGPFVVIEQSAPAGLPPLPHDVPDPRNWIQLSFDTSDRRVNVTLTDDGSHLSATAESPDCSVGVYYLQYASRGDERRLYAAMDTSLAELVRHCGGRMEALGQYRRRFQRSRADFPAAIRLMKARVATVFGARAERCLPPEPSEYWNVHWC